MDRVHPARLLETFFESTLTSIAFLDGDFNFVRVNAAYAKACRRAVGDFPGRNHFELYPSDAKPIFEKVVATGQPFRTYARPFTFPDDPARGVTYWDWTLVPIVGASGEVELLAFALNEVTERERALERLRARDDRERHVEALEAVVRLAAGVAHDMSNMLQAIALHATALAKSGDYTTGHVDVTAILHATSNATRLTQQLLAIGRQQVMHEDIVDVNAVIEHARANITRLAGDAVTVRWVLEPALGLIRCDAAQLEQVLINLVLNARDAMPAGGDLTIATANVKVDRENPPEHPELAPRRYVKVDVIDTGTGMEPQTRARIFEPFFTTKSGRGTGLGLAQAYGIVKQCGGEIFVFSEPGRGTTFSIFAPSVDDRRAGGDS